MNGMVLLIPLALAMGGIGLATFAWALRRGQFDDMDGAANRILIDEDDLP
ncbi:MAG: cbb3-type cytochrome oxidase assembly protein CcoS [Novosphingobium sp.]